MKLLLDTHAFLWTILEPERLAAKLLSELEDSENEVFVSAVSLWEISIKARLKKINLIRLTTDDLIPSANKMGFNFINLDPEEAVTQHKLTEDSHFDPFDRILIWQAISRKMVLVSGDAEFKRFRKDGLKVLWD